MPEHPKNFNLKKEEYLTIRSLQIDRSVIIKGNGSEVIFWDRQDYLEEAERQHRDSSIYRGVKVTEDLTYLVDKSNKVFASLQRKSIIQERGTTLNLFSKKLSMNDGEFY